MGAQRTRLRNKYGIQHDDCCSCCSCCFQGDIGRTSDCCMHWWCSVCVMCQEWREIELLKQDGSVARLAHVPDAPMGMQAGGVMMAPAPMAPMMQPGAAPVVAATVVTAQPGAPVVQATAYKPPGL
mmetsp:Transcript_26687/g.91149  ORF Transcript_26687/g.91149 Transcript_26687/m.91149 type:complete len:126 (+) Transcript_26687:543-920(+)